MCNAELREILRLGLEELALEVQLSTQEKILHYIDLLYKWHKVHNLIAACTPRTILIRHVFDSLVLVPFIQGPNILDFGTGAGLPGIPLALVLPTYDFVLLDSSNKKTTFLQHVVLKLGMQNVTVVTSRIEAFHFAQPFATIVTRATTTVAEVIRKTSQLCAWHGQFLLMKGKMPQEELQELKRPYTSQRVTVPYLTAERHIIKIVN